ncbi:MAG: T9SS type A sorting domain-containing protein [Chitinophagales bacterium]|nr:T9SS type A sorting domain-containing protein [Chitinophagales bacterium]
MVRVVFISFLLLAAKTSWSQRPYGAFENLAIKNELLVTERDYLDTLKPASFVSQNEGGYGCFTGVYNADSGYVSGNNDYGDLEKAQFYNLSEMGIATPATITGTIVYFGLKTLSATPTDIFVRIYEADSSGVNPGNLLMTSNAVNLISVNADGVGTTFTFPAPVNVTNSFFVSVVLPQQSGDTVAVMSTLDDCRVFSGWSWEQWSNGTWHTLLNSWILDIDLAIFPIMDLPFNIGIEESAGIGSTMLIPNPSSGFAFLKIDLLTAEKVSYKIFDNYGRLIISENSGFLQPGIHQIDLNLLTVKNGIYQVVIEAGSRQIHKPLLIFHDR